MLGDNFSALYVNFFLFKQGAEGIKDYGIDKLIQVAASQLSDQLPESREAARTLLLELQNVYEKFNDLVPSTVSEPSEMGSWENFCQSKLSPLSAQAVLRVTSIAREGLVSWHIPTIELQLVYFIYVIWFARPIFSVNTIIFHNDLSCDWSAYWAGNLWCLFTSCAYLRPFDW